MCRVRNRKYEVRRVAGAKCSTLPLRVSHSRKSGKVNEGAAEYRLQWNQHVYLLTLHRLQNIWLLANELFFQYAASFF